MEPKPKELLQVEELIKAGKAQEAVGLVKKFQLTAWTYFYKMESDKALEIAFQSKELLEKIGEEIDLAYNFTLIGNVYIQKSKFKDGLNYAMKSLKLYEKINNRVGIASSLYLVGFAYWFIGNFIQAIEYCEQSLLIKEIEPAIRMYSLNVLGNCYALKGELSQALKYCEEGIKLANNANSPSVQFGFRFFLGSIHTLMDDYDRAIKYLKPNVANTKLSFPYKNLYKGLSLFTLITIYKETGDYKTAHEYLDQLKELADQKSKKIYTNTYLVSKSALLMSESGRTRDRAESEKNLKQIIEDGVEVQGGIGSSLAVYLYALYFLIILYIEELGMSNDLEIVKEINPLIDRLFYLAEKTKSSLLTTNVIIFRAKIALIELNFDKAKILLTEAQEMAETHNIQYHAHRISNYHDDLLEQQDRWNRLKSPNIPLSERIEVASFDDTLDRSRGKHSEEAPEFISEHPVLLLIIGEGGFLIFSYPFADEWKHDTEIFGSFLSAFTSFSDEFFSKGLDRVKFGDDTLLIQSVDSFSVGYLYKGQTYPAKQKLTKFTEEIKNHASTRQTLEKYLKTSQVAELEDLPKVESLIKNIFIT